MITKEFLSSCNEDQIDRGVAWLQAKRLGLRSVCEFNTYGGDLWWYYTQSFSPCYYPNHAWPIIIANNISILNDKGDDCCATNSACDCYYYLDDDFVHVGFQSRDKALRAAMEVYILMEVGK